MVGNRPSALLRWGLDYESVHERHPQLVMLHVSGYGRGGPASDRPGVRHTGQAMSGFAQVTGQPDGPPTLPPFMLADGVAAQAATWAVMMALYHRDLRGGTGQLVDVNLVEPLARLIESSTLAFDQLGTIAGRVGNHLAASAPRNAYLTADGKWLAISSASANIVVRVFRCIGRDDLAEDPDYVDPVRRQARGYEIDAMVAEWIAQRSLDEVMRVFLDADVAAAPVYDAEQLLGDEHLSARGTFPRVEDPTGPGPGPGATGPALGDTRADRPPRPVPGRRERRGLRWSPRSRPPPHRRPAGGRRHLTTPTDGGTCVRTPSPTIRVGHPGQQRAHVCEGAELRCRSGVLGPGGRLRSDGEGVGPGHRGQCLGQPGLGRVVRAVRVNGLETPWCYGDVVDVVTGARDALDVIIVPKARTARDVWWFDVLLTQLETQLGLTKRIGLEVLIEEAEGLSNAAEIARSSDRLEAIIFGAGDLSASLHARVDGNFDPVGDYPGDFWHHARVQILAAARAAGIDAIDAPYPAYEDPEGYRRSAGHASLLGYDGKWAIHPSQIPIANAVFAPTEEEIRDAEESIATYRASEAEGVGAIGREGRLVDAAHMRLAANVLHKAALVASEHADS